MNIQKFVDVVLTSKKIVFFGGAGVSTESGIPDFRSTDGLYNQKYAYPPEVILSHDFFMSRTEEFFSFYRDKMIYVGAKPNVTHKKLAQLEKDGKLLGIVTQNIDGLHEQAGSKNVFNLHGTIYKNTCMRCGKKFGLDKVRDSVGIPRCDCGGIVKPDVVLYGESLDDDTVDGAIDVISRADTLIVGGTSLTVYPAAGLLRYFGGNNLIVINKTPTEMDSRADLLLNCPLGEVFEKL